MHVIINNNIKYACYNNIKIIILYYNTIAKR